MHASALALVEILVVVVVVADFCVFCGRLECGEACAAETSNEPRMLTLLAGHVIGWSPVPSRAGVGGSAGPHVQPQRHHIANGKWDPSTKETGSSVETTVRRSCRFCIAIRETRPGSSIRATLLLRRRLRKMPHEGRGRGLRRSGGQNPTPVAQ